MSSNIINFNASNAKEGETKIDNLNIEPNDKIFSYTVGSQAFVVQIPSEVSTLVPYAPANYFFKKMLANRSLKISIVGDSTGNENDEWVYYLAEKLAGKFPDYTIMQRIYDESPGTFLFDDIISLGESGEAKAFMASGGADSHYETPDSTDLDITGDISARAKIKLPDWNSISGQLNILNKFGSSGNRSWRLYLQSTGEVVFEWTEDGSSLKTLISSSKVNFSDNTAGWFRADLDVDDGASGHTVKFYTSTDGESWTQLGATQTGVGTTSIYSGTSNLRIFNRPDDTATRYGFCYAADVYENLDSSEILKASWRAGEMEFTYNDNGKQISGYDVCGNLWTGNTLATSNGKSGSRVLTICNGSISGYSIDDFEGTTLPNILTNMKPELVFINLGHNGTESSTFDSYSDRLKSLADDIITNSSKSGVVFTTQNAKASPQGSDSISRQSWAMEETRLAATNGSYGLTDPNEVLRKDTGLYTDTDGIHPTVVGSQKWADIVYNYLLGA